MYRAIRPVAPPKLPVEYRACTAKDRTAPYPVGLAWTDTRLPPRSRCLRSRSRGRNRNRNRNTNTRRKLLAPPPLPSPFSPRLPFGTTPLTSPHRNRNQDKLHVRYPYRTVLSWGQVCWRGQKKVAEQSLTDGDQVVPNGSVQCRASKVPSGWNVRAKKYQGVHCQRYRGGLCWPTLLVGPVGYLYLAPYLAPHLAHSNRLGTYLGT